MALGPGDAGRTWRAARQGTMPGATAARLPSRRPRRARLRPETGGTHPYAGPTAPTSAGRRATLTRTERDPLHTRFVGRGVRASQGRAGETTRGSAGSCGASADAPWDRVPACVTGRQGTAARSPEERPVPGTPGTGRIKAFRPSGAVFPLPPVRRARPGASPMPAPTAGPCVRLRPRRARVPRRPALRGTRHPASGPRPGTRHLTRNSDFRRRLPAISAALSTGQLLPRHRPGLPTGTGRAPQTGQHGPMLPPVPRWRYRVPAAAKDLGSRSSASRVALR